MICKTCQKQITDDSLFCTHCGAPTSEFQPPKQRCSQCGFVQTENDCKYCSNCGLRLDGKNECPGCGHEFMGTYCTKCGKLGRFSSLPKTNFDYSPRPTHTHTSSTTWKNTTDKISVGLGLLSALIALIFCFFTSYSVYLPGDLKYAINLNSYDPSQFTIYYYFGDVYTNLSKSLEALVYYTGYSETLFTVTCIIGTCICALCILLPLVFTVLAAVYAIRYFIGFSKKSPFKFSVYATLSYVATASAFSILNCGFFQTDSSTALSGSILLSPVTIVGIVLSLITLIASVVLSLISKPTGYYSPNTVSALVFSAIKISLLTAVCCLVVNITSHSVTQYGITITTNYNAIQFIPLLANLFVNHTDFNNNSAYATQAFSACLIGSLLNIVTIFLVFQAIAQTISNPDKPYKVSAIILDSVKVILSILTIVALALFAQSFSHVQIGFQSSEVTWIPVIVYAILLTVCLIATIVSRILKRKEK